MGVTRGKNQREALLREMRRLAEAKVNDAVKLAYLTEEQVDLIDKLDLRAITEFKRSEKGAVEVKFSDKIKVVEQILTHSDSDEERQVEALLAALGGQEPSP